MFLVRDKIIELWKSVESGGFATTHIAQAFRADRRIGSQERKLVAESLYGMLRLHRRLRFALKPFNPPKPDTREGILALLLAWNVLEESMPFSEAAELLPGIPWQDLSSVDIRIEAIEDPVSRLALRRSLPDFVARRLLEDLGEAADAFAASLNRRAPLTVRANTLKTTRDALAASLAEAGIETSPCRWADAGLKLLGHTNVFGLPQFSEGLLEVQDEASQLAAMLTAPPPGSVVLDACAGAGGKTLALAAIMHNKGRLIALDVSVGKLHELTKRARRAGISNLRSMPTPDDALPPGLTKAAGGPILRAFVDAPCSGLGSWRRNPEARWRLLEEDLTRLPELQFAIAHRAASILPPGGRLIYATCTVLTAENQGVVTRLLEALPGFELVRPAEIWGTAMAKDLVSADGAYLQTMPHIHGTDGFFAAVLRRKRSGIAP
jgi:16S rRNA (cytosine967-C5)-methyltransferase